jgi:hypothetical protein
MEMAGVQRFYTRSTLSTSLERVTLSSRLTFAISYYQIFMTHDSYSAL